jgi:hypothetical protein
MEAKKLPEAVSLREDLGIIHVDSHGDVSAQELGKSLEIILRSHHESGISCVLVDGHQVSSYPSAMPAFDFGTDLARARPLRFAVLGAPGNVAALRFVETVTINCGGAFKVFDSESDALEWLRRWSQKPGVSDIR